MRGVPGGAAALLVRLAIDQDANMELACEAEQLEPQGGGEEPPQGMGSMKRLAAVTVPLASEA